MKPAFSLREFVLGDLPAIATIRNASVSLSADFFSMTVDRFRYDLYAEDRPMQSRIEVATEPDGAVIGFYHLYADARPQAEGRPLRANLDSLHVLPRARGTGVGAALVAAAAETARAWGARSLGIAVPERDRGSAAFLSKQGFSPSRTFYLMRMTDLSERPAALAPGLAVRTFRPGLDEAAFLEAFNACFADHWDFSPLSLEDVVAWNQREGFDPAGCFLVFDGPTVVAFTTVTYDPDRAIGTGEAVGRIFEMGVRPAYRRRGLAVALLNEAVAYARARRFSALDLVTDAENAAGVALYAKMGFSEKRATIAWEMPL